MADSILEAVNAANNTIVEEESKSATTSSGVKTEETQTESAPVVEDQEEEVKLDKRTTDALGILELLENPETAKDFILQLATKAGLVNSGSTPAEVKKAAKSATEVIKEKLGDNYEFLSGPIGDALTEILNSQRSEFQAELQKRDKELFQANFAKEYQQVTTELKITESEAAALNTKVQKFPNYGTVPLKEYLGDMLKLVRMEQSETSERRKTTEKQKQNLSEKLPQGTEVTEITEKNSNGAKTKMTAKQAVELAMRQQRVG